MAVSVTASRFVSTPHTPVGRKGARCRARPGLHLTDADAVFPVCLGDIMAGTRGSVNSMVFGALSVAQAAVHPLTL